MAAVATTNLSNGLLDARDNNFNSDVARKRIKYFPQSTTRSNRHTDSTSTMPVSTTITPRRRVPLSRRFTAVSRSQRNRNAARPTFDSAAAAAAAATTQVDGYKPREERSWEEFHPDLDIEAKIAVFSSNEVDGVPTDAAKANVAAAGDLAKAGDTPGKTNVPNQEIQTPPTVIKRRPGRPFRNPQNMLNGLGTPPSARITPLPSQNPRERLNLPKPSYRKIETFAAFEADRANQINYVDKTMANVGYQESEIYFGNDKHFIRLMERTLKEDNEPSLVLEADQDPDRAAVAPPVSRVEYDMDEQDEGWLEEHNQHRRQEGVDNIKPSMFEITMTQIEKEWHALERRIPKPNPKPPQTHRPRSSSAAAVNGEPVPDGEEQDSKCAICDDGDCENANAIVFCDGCDLAVHQECYGVPYIPEGQWLCRKCREIGRSTPACIFCPNPDGAFKKSAEGKWVHLLCAIWIPEVTIATRSIMEPIDGVANVPKNRWKLTCYICHQKMGACIQCGMRQCFQAFHVTCARKAKLSLKMKPSQGGPFNIDAGVLTAYCDKHVSPEWEEEHDTHNATIKAKDFYRRNMRGRRWADSQQAALSLISSNHGQLADTFAIQSSQTEGQSGAHAAAQKKRLLQAQKNVWRLPSGAPVVPQVVFEAVELSLQRFALRRRKEFVAEACKYWTLKREARRGAALLKRLQLQLETFSSTELTRRDFSAMGAAGRPRLQRRKDMADMLLADMASIRSICEAIREREAEKLKSAKVLRDVVDAMYLPLPPLLRPIVFKTLQLDIKHLFKKEIIKIQDKVELSAYSSVSTFVSDIGKVFRSVIGGVDSITEVYDNIDRSSGPTNKELGLNSEQKEVKKVTKRIVKATQPLLLHALRAESELQESILDDEWSMLRTLLLGDSSGLDLATESEVLAGINGDRNESPDPLTNGDSNAARSNDAINPNAASSDPIIATTKLPNGSEEGSVREVPAQGMDSANEIERPNGITNGAVASNGDPPATSIENDAKVPPIIKTDDAREVLHGSQGGIPWYLEAFDPVGTTFQEERWIGREVVRGMSEDLSSLGEEELNDLSMNIDDDEDEDDVDANGIENGQAEMASDSVKRRQAKKRKRRGFW